MRLLNRDTLELKEFFDSDVPAYDILSHTWSTEECSLQSFVESKHAAIKSAGVQKVLQFCNLMKSELGRPDWVWADTCCIDKTSSAELSEAINSMYRWYADAKTCVVYLSDLDASEKVHPAVAKLDFETKMANSRYFTRGWTLQELLAPKNVIFYDRDWSPLGTKLDLLGLLSSITSISCDYLANPRNIADASVACRMSWAARRRTSRLEDRAYSLLGIFDINMPLIYGEGPKAFRRLLKEIINTIDDESVFAWSRRKIVGGDPYLGGEPFVGFLPDSPESYEGSADIVPAEFERRAPAAITSRGVLLHMVKVPTTSMFRLWLNCCDGSGDRVRFNVFRVTGREGRVSHSRNVTLHSAPCPPANQLPVNDTIATEPLYLQL